MIPESIVNATMALYVFSGRLVEYNESNRNAEE